MTVRWTVKSRGGPSADEARDPIPSTQRTTSRCHSERPLLRAAKNLIPTKHTHDSPFPPPKEPLSAVIAKPSCGRLWQSVSFSNKTHTRQPASPAQRTTSRCHCEAVLRTAAAIRLPLMKTILKRKRETERLPDLTCFPCAFAGARHTLCLPAVLR